MLTKVNALNAIQQQLRPDETVEDSVMAYYLVPSGLSRAASPMPIKGLLAATNQRILFLEEAGNYFDVKLEMDYYDITKITENKELIGLFKSIPIIAVYHKDREAFSSQGNPDEFEELKAFYDKVQSRWAVMSQR